MIKSRTQSERSVVVVDVFLVVVAVADGDTTECKLLFVIWPEQAAAKLWSPTEAAGRRRDPDPIVVVRRTAYQPPFIFPGFLDGMKLAALGLTTGQATCQHGPPFSESPAFSPQPLHWSPVVARRGKARCRRLDQMPAPTSQTATPTRTRSGPPRIYPWQRHARRVSRAQPRSARKSRARAPSRTRSLLRPRRPSPAP